MQTMILFIALAALAGGGGRGTSTHQTHEMTVPNEIIGCVIGKGGSKIAEIRWVMVDSSRNLLKRNVNCQNKQERKVSCELLRGKISTLSKERQTNGC